ncbi:MAG: glutathione binding-like protein [Caulobacteraceae bacterium]
MRLISRLCDFYLVMAMRPLFTASGQSRKRWDRAAIDRGLAEVTNALGYIEHYLGDGGYAVGDKLTWADGALVPQPDALLRVGPGAVRIGEPAR